MEDFVAPFEQPVVEKPTTTPQRTFTQQTTSTTSDTITSRPRRTYDFSK
jgi:hypothetical protein